MVGSDVDLAPEEAADGAAEPVASSGGRVICVSKDIGGRIACFVETSTFTLIDVNVGPQDGITLKEVQAIADAIAAQYP